MPTRRASHTCWTWQICWPRTDVTWCTTATSVSRLISVCSGLPSLPEQLGSPRAHAWKKKKGGLTEPPQAAMAAASGASYQPPGRTALLHHTPICHKTSVMGEVLWGHQERQQWAARTVWKVHKPNGTKATTTILSSVTSLTIALAMVRTGVVMVLPYRHFNCSSSSLAQSLRILGRFVWFEIWVCGKNILS